MLLLEQFFLGLQRESTDKMTEAYRKAGAKVREMTKAEFDEWVALAKRTSWADYAAMSPEAKELLEQLQQVK